MNLRVDDGVIRWPTCHIRADTSLIDRNELPLQIESGIIICYFDRHRERAEKYLKDRGIVYTVEVVVEQKEHKAATDGVRFNTRSEVLKRLADPDYYPPGEEVKQLKKQLKDLKEKYERGYVDGTQSNNK